MKFKQALEEFSKWKAPQVKGNTIYGYHWQLVNFGIFLHDKDIEKISINEVVEFLNLSQYYNHTSSTREKQALAIKEIFKYWQMRELNVMNPDLVPKIRSDGPPIPRVASESDYYKLINVMPKFGYSHIRNRAIASLLFDSGARLNEILLLNVSDVQEIDNKHITIRTEKHTDKSPFRNIFFREATAVYLKTWLVKREELLKKLAIEDKDALFISIRGGACGDQTEARRCSIDAIGECFRKYSKKAGLKSYFNAHSLRHRLGRVLAEKEVDDLLIAQIMGHNSVDTSRRYTELFGPVLHRIYTKVMGK